MRLPPPLTAGARVALIAPAGPLFGAKELSDATDNARMLGWEPVSAANVLAKKGYVAGSVAERLTDLNTALADESVDAIWCVRGGYGVMHLLEHIDYASLTRRPRALMGYSDITALHTAVATRCQLVTYHGPTAREPMSHFTRDSFMRAVVDQRDPCGHAPDARVLRGGRAHGPLVGGNLSLLAALVGTPYAPNYRGAILVLEDVGEQTYRIDRMLTQLALSGAFREIVGLVIGHFTEGSSPRLTDALLREVTDAVGVPAISGAPIGHNVDQWTIPLGASADLDADALCLTVRL